MQSPSARRVIGPGACDAFPAEDRLVGKRVAGRLTELTKERQADRRG
jgi:hypothetical protein